MQFLERFLKLEMPFGFHLLALPAGGENRGVERSGNSIIRSGGGYETLLWGRKHAIGNRKMHKG